MTVDWPAVDLAAGRITVPAGIRCSACGRFACWVGKAWLSPEGWWGDRCAGCGPAKTREGR